MPELSDLSKLAGYGEASKAVDAHTSPRAKRLQHLECWVEGTQYEGQPDWFSDEAPYFERAPCIVYPIVKSAVGSFVDLVLGEGRFPEALVGSTDEDSPWDDEDALDDDDEAKLQRFIGECIKQSRFARVARESLAAAMGGCSAVVIFGVRNGKLIADTTRARWCEPELDVDGNVEKLVIQYPFLEQYQERGKWKVRARLYRRVIDAEADTTYKPADIKADSYSEPKWQADAERTVEHGLGFCPAVWYPFMRGCSVVGNIDGHAIHENLLDELRAMDFALSQRHRAALYAGDPQWTETGVDAGYNPSGTARVGDMPATPAGGKMSTENPPRGSYVAGGTQTKMGRRKSPSTIWQYEAADAKITLHTLPPGALQAISEHTQDLRAKVAESLSVVFLDPDTVRFAASLSGKALEALRARQLDRCDQIRDDVGDGLLLPGVQMLLRVANTIGVNGGLRTPGLKQTLPLLQRQEPADAVAAA